MKLRNYILLLIIAVTGSILICNAAETQQPIYKANLFSKGDYGYNTFRIPALVVSKKGTILAFAEARKNSRSDTGDIDLVMKRSTDGGKTWSEMIMVWDDAENVCGNPCPVVDEKTGRIIVLSTWNLGKDHEKDIHKKTSQDTRRVYMLHSDDDGVTWSEAREITDMAKNPVWGWYATGPCHAIQLKNGPYKGRLIAPCDHSNVPGDYTGPVGENKTTSFSHIIYSDDIGQTWKIGGISAAGGNECTIVERTDGSLMLNMRGPRGERENGKCRMVAISRDGGQTLEPTYWNQSLQEPVCQASILNYTPKGKLTSTILFSNPNHPDKRMNMTIKISHDNGQTWANEYQVFGKFTAYSDIVVLNKGDIGIFYESGEETSYDRIAFERLPAKLFKK